MKVLFGQPDPLCEGPVVVEDSKYRAMGAMSVPTREASRTGVAATIDLADTTRCPGVSARLGDTDKLVPQNSFITHIAMESIAGRSSQIPASLTRRGMWQRREPAGIGRLEPQLTGL